MEFEHLCIDDEAKLLCEQAREVLDGISEVEWSLVNKKFKTPQGWWNQ